MHLLIKVIVFLFFSKPLKFLFYDKNVKTWRKNLWLASWTLWARSWMIGFEPESQEFCTSIYTQGTVRCLAKACWFVFDHTGRGHYTWWFIAESTSFSTCVMSVSLKLHRCSVSLLWLLTGNIFSGKMFQAPDLTLIVEFIFMFYKDKPIDWLLDHILWVKVCNPEKDAVR